MSAPTKRRRITWTDEAGNQYKQTRREPTRGATLGSIPAAMHVVAAYCPSRHLTAVLVLNGDGAPPVVMVHGSGEPVPQLLLLASGDLVAAFVTADDDGAHYIAPMGTPRQRFEVDCPSCGSTGGAYRLSGLALVQALSSGRKKIGLERAETQ